MARLTWPEYFMSIARLVAERSTCLRRKVGAVAVKDRHMLATGYNGAPSGIVHCDVTGCLRAQLGIPSGQRHEMCRGLHAEQNVIIQAAMHGISLDGAELFCTAQPCIICAKMLINCNVSTIWFAGPYPDDLSTSMLAEAGVSLRHIELPDTVSPLLPEPGKTECGNSGDPCCGGCAHDPSL